MKSLREIVRDAILARLDEFGGSRQLTAHSLRISVRCLRMKLTKYRAEGMVVKKSDYRRFETGLPD